MVVLVQENNKSGKGRPTTFCDPPFTNIGGETVSVRKGP